MSEEKIIGPDEKYCSECGEIIRLKAEICPKCGVRQIIETPKKIQGNKEKSLTVPREYSTKNKLLWWLISIILIVCLVVFADLPTGIYEGVLGLSDSMMLAVLLLLLITAIIINPLLNNIFNKTRWFNKPGLRILPGIITIVLMLIISSVQQSSENKKKEFLNSRRAIVEQTKRSIESEYSKNGMGAYDLMGDWKTDKDWDGSVTIITRYGSEILKDVTIRVKDDGSFIWKVK